MRPDTPTADAVQDQMVRLVGSGALRNSERLCHLVRFAIAKTLEGQTGSLKESVLGVEVFRRKPGYDSRSDAIVRVEFARLRSRIRAYYSSDGAADEVVIDFPTGSYIPV